MKRFTALALAAALALSCAACSSGTSSETESKEPEAPQGMTDGTYTATAAGNASDITVTVTIKDNAITEIAMEGNDSAHIQAEVEAILPARIIEAQSTSVDAVSGATMTSSAVLRAVRDCVAQAGGDLSAKPETQTTQETIDCDVVIVGAGLSGLTTANKLLSEGVNVVVLEQLDITGGTTRYAGGSMFGTLVPDYDPAALGEKYGVSGSEKVEQMMASVGDTFDFYKSLGFQLDTEGPDEPYRIKVYNEDIGSAEDEGGYLWSKSLELAFTDRGGKLLLGTKAVGLRTDASGAVTGVDAVTDTGTVTVNAKYTVMATGSAAWSQELLSVYCPTKADGELTQASVGSDGKGIAMMLELGAVPLEGWNAGLGIPCVGFQIGRSDRDDWTSPLAVADALFVDYDGVRRAPESTGRFFSPAYDVVGKADAYFTVFDSALAEQLGFTDRLEEGVTGNTSHFWKAGTLEELAQKAGFDEQTFLATVEEYNGYCASGADEAFGKDAKYLNAIAQGPFYVVKHELMSLDVTGGVVTSNSFEVLKADGEPIPGLYAVGSTAVGDIVGFAGGSNLACGAYMSLTAAESILSNLK